LQVVTASASKYHSERRTMNLTMVQITMHDQSEVG
jgi:hypothetical protein